MSDDYKQRYERLVLMLREHEGLGIFMMGHLTHEQRESFRETDAWKCGWNAAIIEDTKMSNKVIEQAERESDHDVTMLLASGGCFLGEDGTISLNMNDTWGWALAWLPTVPKEQFSAVARLFREYGRAGLLYWHSCQENNMRSEFVDVNRAIDFVRHEEELIARMPNSNKRAYEKIIYTVGG